MPKLSKSLWRHSPVLVSGSCCKRVKVDFVTGAALWSYLCKFRRSHLGADYVAGARLWVSRISRCGAVPVWITQSEPPAHLGL